MQSLSSATSLARQRVSFQVSADVAAGGQIVIAEGSSAWGVVVEAAPRGRMGKAGRLEIDIQAVCMADGTAARLQAVSNTATDVNGQREQVSGEPENLALLPALPFLLFMEGQEVEIPAGRITTVFLAEPVELFPDRITDGPMPDCSPAEQRQTSDSRGPLSSLTVRASIIGAEILVDGTLAGRTPAVLRLEPGRHIVMVRGPNRTSWQKVMELAPGGESVIEAQFESTPIPRQLPTGRPVPGGQVASR